MAANIEAMVAVEGVGDDLRDARQAKRFTGYYDISGNPIFERDWTVALDAVDKLGTLIAKTRTKDGGGVNIAIQNNTANVNGNGNGNGRVRSFEALVREAEKRRRLELGDGSGVTVGELSAKQGDQEGIIDGDPVESDVDLDGADVDAEGETDSYDPDDPGVELDDPDEMDEEEG